MRSSYIFLPGLLSVGILSCSGSESTSATQGVTDLDIPPHDSKNLDICWENNTDETRACSLSLEDVILKEFDGKTDLSLNFFDTCEGVSAGIKIFWQSLETVASAIMRDGALVHYQIRTICDDFSNAEAYQLRERCRSSEESRLCTLNVGIHEFGHAVGLAHENHRPESSGNSDCYEGPYEGQNYAVITEYDEYSIMNFCYYQDVVGSSLIGLSELDVIAINRLYQRDITFPEEKCGEGYVFIREKGICAIKPTQQDSRESL